jgi:hypothetical protein
MDHSTHIFAGRISKPAVCLFALQKRHIQPKRYVQYGLKFIMNKKIGIL